MKLTGLFRSLDSFVARMRVRGKTFISLRIGTRLALAFSVVLSLTVALGVFAIVQLSVVRQASTDISTKWMIGARLTSQLNTESSNFRIAEAQHILSSDADERLKYEKEIKAITALMDKDAQDYADLISSPEEKKLWDEFKRERGRYLDEHAKVIRLSSTDQTEDAKLLLRYNSQQKYDRAAAALKRLVDFNVNGGQEASLRGDATYTSSRVWIISALLSAIVVGAVLALAITRSITRPIKEALRVADAVAKGDLTVEIRATGTDEAGQLLHALRAMNGGLTKLVSDVHDGSERIAVNSREIAAGNMDLSHRTEKQAANLQQIVGSIAQLNASVQANSESASQAATLSEQSSQLAESGGRVMQNVVQTMQEIALASKKIGEVTGIIDGIAFQTNILALNAAVEAARAGESGRSFGVVASEVRSLAGHSAQAAKDIKELISQSLATVQAGSQLVKEAGLAMNAIVAEAKRVHNLIGDISASSTEQSCGIATVREAIAQLDIATQQNTALVEESAAASESLRDQAQYLVDAVAVFRTSDKPDSVSS
jgi:methyl-accepting chemotaxis protein